MNKEQRKTKQKEQATKSRVQRTKKVFSVDYTLLLILSGVLCFGLVMLLSASTPAGRTLHDNAYYFFIRQLAFVFVGLACLYIAFRFDYHNYDKFIKKAYFVCIFLLILVQIPGVGLELNGAKRWIDLKVFQLQPSELAKPCIAIFFASMIVGGKYDIKKYKQLFMFAVALAPIVLFLVLEPHLSCLAVVVIIAICVLIVGGTKVIPLLLTCALLLAVGTPIVWKFFPVRWERITTFINPFADVQGAGYQVVQSLYAIGSGGIFGRGLGQSVQKYAYLPEPYNDFIFAVICEELGLIGAIAVIALFTILVIRIFQIARNAPDTFGRLIATGIGTQVGIQALLNVAVATSSFPNTGMSLPFFSYGGTSIIVLLAEMGILLNIASQSKLK